MKALSHEKRQHSFVQFEFVSLCRNKFDPAKQELLRDFQLKFVTEPMKDELFVDAGENLRSSTCWSHSRGLITDSSG